MAEEIEIKLIYNDLGEAEKALAACNLKKEETIDLIDRYYGKQDGMENTHDLIRIRQKGNKKELTFKGSCKDEKGVWTREELNIPILDVEAMNQFLLKIGLKLIKENASKRTFWRDNLTEVVFIDYSKPTKLTLIEIESTSKEEIDGIVKGLGNNAKIVGEEIFSCFDKK